MDDAPRLVAAWNDAEIERWNAVPPEPTLAVAQRWIKGVAQRRAKNVSIDFVIATNSTGGGHVVGEVGLSGMSKDHAGAFIGYWLLPEARGHGLASDAVQAVVRWAGQELSLDVLVARCAAANVASHAVAQRAGFRHEANDPNGEQLWKIRARGERIL